MLTTVENNEQSHFKMGPELPSQRNCTSYTSNLWNVKTGLNNLRTGTNTCLCSTELQS